MIHRRARLNALIFHNQTVLPRTSPGFGEVSLAVAELQGGNYDKAAMFAERAVSKDPSLAAAWLAKTAADVFEATPDDLRKERAVFCMERALECAPSCHTEMVEFFVANILGHYVEVFCASAVEESGLWLELEAEADQLAAQAMQMGWQAAGLRTEAGLLAATGLVSAFIALFSRRLGTQVLGGVASATAFSEAARRTRDAALLEDMSNSLRAMSTSLRLEGGQHRATSMIHFVPARDLIALGTQLLQAEGLPEQVLAPAVDTFTTAFRQVLGTHLKWLERQLAVPIWTAINGDKGALVASYNLQPDALSLAGWNPAGTPLTASGLEKTEHPASRTLALWLGHMLPGTTKLEAHRLLTFPLGSIAKTVSREKDTFGGCCVVLLILFLVAAAYSTVAWLVPALFCAWGSYSAGRNIFRGRAHLREVAASLWSVDMWLGGRAGDLLNAQVGVQGHSKKPLAYTYPDPGTDRFKYAKRWLMVGAIVLGMALLQDKFHPDGGAAAKPTRDTVPSPAPTLQSDGAAKHAPVVRRAIAVPTPGPPAIQSDQSDNPTLSEASYSVTGIGSGDTLSVHARPAMNSTVSAKLPGDATGLTIIGAPVMNGPTEWVQVNFEGRTGWVAKRFLKPERQ